MKLLLNIFTLCLLSGYLDAQCPAITNCPAGPVDICDISINDPQLWNESYWLDPTISSHDMADGQVELSLSAADTCVGGLNIRFLLFLDLDGDGTMETVLNSDSLALLASGTVAYNNVGNPGYGGGTPSNFDERSVSADQKYRFALEESGNGTNKTAWVRWNTDAAPGTYQNPELPYGTHKIKWFVTNNLGEQVQCEYTFTVKDCKEPAVVCINGLSVNLLPTAFVQLWATDFLQYTDDNHTPSNQLEVGIRRSGTGTGFPEQPNGAPQNSIVYTCDDLGTDTVEVWSRDVSGNAGFCETYVIIGDNAGFCSGNWAMVDLKICINHWCDNSPLTGTDFELSGSHPALPPVNLFFQTDTMPYDAAGCLLSGALSYGIPILSNYTFTPAKDDYPLNGVTVEDLIHISQHILGISPLPSPYAMIAADVNKSRSITTLDIVELRKLLLGTYLELPNNTSWRFVDAGYVFANPNNPFQAIFPETRELVSFGDTIQDEVHFKAIKIGDVDCSAIPGVAGVDPDNRSVYNLRIPDVRLFPGETVDVPVYPAEAAEWLGFQLGLQFDAERLAVEAVLPGDLPAWDGNAAAQPRPGMLNIVWFNAKPCMVQPGQPLFILRLKALEPLHVGEVLGLSGARLQAEAVTSNDGVHNLQLQFSPVLADGSGIGLPQPNPTAGGAVVAFQTTGGVPIYFDVLDQQGRRVWQLYARATTGMQQITIPASAFPDSGLYFWQMRAGVDMRSGKIMVMR